MNMSKHAHARFKQRQKLKNVEEMKRRCALAIGRGLLIPGGSRHKDALCYEYAGYRYIVSTIQNTIITAFPIKQYGRSRKAYLVEQSRLRQLRKEEYELLGA